MIKTTRSRSKVIADLLRPEHRSLTADGLRRLRTEKLACTQERLAIELGVHPETLRTWEKHGLNDVSKVIHIRLLVALGPLTGTVVREVAP